MLTEKSIRQIT